jgi:hypothetical protein
VLQLSDLDKNVWGKGGFRLVSKRCLRVVESVATRLTHKGFAESLPRVEEMQEDRAHQMKSLEGCPDGLKSLYIEYGQYIESLEPLSACKELETLELNFIINVPDLSPLLLCKRLKSLFLGCLSLVDLTPLSSMPLLQNLDLRNYPDFPSIDDLSPLSKCKKLKQLNIRGNKDIKDLSSLCHCPDLEELHTPHLFL